MSGQMTAKLVKLALIRDDETPVGQPGTMHLNCPCGTTIPIPAHPFSYERVVTCEGCGNQYNHAGWRC